MMRIEWPAAIRPYTRPIRPPVTWAAGTRPAQIGQIPDRFRILVGNLNNDAVLQRGGVLAPAEYQSINVHEVVRCTTLAMRRRYELMGPVCEFDPLTNELVATYDLRLTEPNHWSQAWINIQRGYALAAAGNFAEAETSLRAAVVLAGQWDHPLTPMALFGLGQMAMEQDRLPEAGKLFIDASVAAAVFEQPELVEDAMQYACDVHLALKPQAELATLAPVMAWAQQARWRHLHATLCTLSAEQLTTFGKSAAAGKLLVQASRSLDRRATLAAPMLARHDFVSAHVNYQLGKLSAAGSALERAINRQQAVSPWLFQIGMTDALFRARTGALTARAAGALLERLLRDPSRGDWNMRPLDTMCYMLSPNRPAYEQWFQIVMERGETERALEVADRMRRQRFFSQLPLGGRLLAFRRLTSADEATLTAAEIELRNDLFTRYPTARELASQSDRLRQELIQLPIALADEDQLAQQKSLAAQLEEIAAKQEALFGEIALRREYCPLVFPPFHSTNEIQEHLRDGQLALVYVNTAQGLYAFMLSGDSYATWQVAKPAQLRRDFARLLKAFGLTSENAVVSIDQLQDESWQALADGVFRGLIDRGQTGFWNNHEELLIIPDGLLWYLPFEALPANEAGEPYEPLISKIRLRYLPTAGMICQPPAARKRQPRTAVVLGKLFPKDDSEVAQEQARDMQEIVTGLEVLPARLGADTGLLRTTWDRLLVLDDIDDTRAGGLSWSPGRVDEGRPGSTLGRWLAFPWGGPQQVLLPGFHTATESGLRKSGTGDEVFLAATTLMATGAETVLISRWRTGGQACFDLIREFLQEEPQATPAEAWQRSLQILRETELDPKAEPRVSPTKGAAPLSAAHPFFWAGYMLLDIAGNRAD